MAKPDPHREEDRLACQRAVDDLARRQKKGNAIVACVIVAFILFCFVVSFLLRS